MATLLQTQHFPAPNSPESVPSLSQPLRGVQKKREGVAVASATVPMGTPACEITGLFCL